MRDTESKRRRLVRVFVELEAADQDVLLAKAEALQEERIRSAQSMSRSKSSSGKS